MHQIARYTFYDVQDPEEVIINAYADTSVDRDTSATVYPFVIKVARESSATLYKQLVHDEVSKKAFVRTLNIRITDRIIPIYENHWMEFMGDGGYRANPQIIKMDSTVASVIDIKHTYPEEYKKMLMELHKTSYFVFDKRTGFSKEGFITINVNDYIIDLLIKQFSGSYFKDGKIYIKYGPYFDISQAIWLTRLLHTFL